MNDLLGYRTIFGQDTTICKSGGYIEKIYFKFVQINFLAMNITIKNEVLI